MTNSYRHTPRMGLAATSDKRFKVFAHRSQRRAVNVWLTIKYINPYAPMPDPRKFGNPWSGPKDGKRRFDPTQYAKGMRK